jgi:flagellar capping protein FliD
MKLETMVEAYNDVVTFIKENTSYNEETGEAGLLMTDSTIKSLRDFLRLPLIQQTSGFLLDVDSFLMPGQIGLELDRDGLLSLDSSVFNEAVADNYLGLLALIGADKTGSSDSNTVEFYGASSDYTEGGTYNVEVTVSGGAITGARIKLDDESTYRDATFAGNIVVGDSTFDDDGEPLYAENGLQLSVDLSQDGVFTATVRVKQGFAGAMQDATDRILKSTTGVLALDQDSVETRIESLEEDIADEETRLSRREERLRAQYARLERALTMLQRQMSALSALS